MLPQSHRSECTLCWWVSEDYLTHDLAGCRASWHVYEAHPEAWAALFGSRPPVDPDPRKGTHSDV